MRRSHVVSIFAVLLGFMLGAAVPARGQHQVHDGRALDANLQRGSGGYNPAQATPDFARRNDLITGNVTGLGQFRDRVGYAAPGEFRDRVSSDDLFRFRAQSFPTAPPTTYSAGQAAAIGLPPSVYGAQAPTSAGMVQEHRLPGTLVRPAETFVEPMQFRYGVELLPAEPVILPLPEGVAAAAGAGPGRLPGSLGLFQGADGRLLEVSASPLLGVRTTDLDPAALGLPSAALAEPEAEPLAGAAEAADPRQPRGAGAPIARPEPRPGAAALDARVPAQPLRPPPVMGQIEEAPEALTEERDDQLGPRPAPGDDPYEDLIRRLRRPAREGEVPVHEEGVAPFERAGLELPGAAERREAEEARQRAARRARGLPEEPLPAESPDEAGTEPPGAAEGPEAGDAGEIAPGDDRLPQTLRLNLPPLPTLAGQRRTAFNDLLRAAENDFSDQQFFDAERRYRQALQVNPGHPMATVGLIHAQLGAGLLRTAGFNLRALFERHPELIAVRYEARLLPPDERARTLYDELLGMVRTTDQQEPALLLAYIGYQWRSPELARFGLDLAEARTPRDPLVALLRQQWIEATGLGEPAAPPPAAPAEDPAANSSPTSPPPADERSP